MKKTVLVGLLLILIANFSYRLDLKRSPHELVGELMYFPSGMALRALSMGFYAPLADFVWLRFIQYYGEHRMTDARFDYLFHILDILTTLNPYFPYGYTLGGLMLTHDAQSPEKAKLLLKKGMMHNPDDWRYPYIYAFIYYVFLKEYNTARIYFRLSANKPNAPDMPKRWAAFVTYYRLGDLKAALALWADLYHASTNPEERQIAEYYMFKIQMKIDIEFLNEKAKDFRQITGRNPVRLDDLVKYDLIETVPKEPHGKEYIVRNGTVHSTWLEK